MKLKNKMKNFKLFKKINQRFCLPCKSLGIATESAESVSQPASISHTVGCEMELMLSFFIVVPTETFASRSEIGWYENGLKTCSPLCVLAFYPIQLMIFNLS